MKQPKLIIFDFDGVVADSEYLACKTAAEYATELGSPMGTAEGLHYFLGKRASEVREHISKNGGTPPSNFERKLLTRTLDAFEGHLNAVAGVKEFLVNTKDTANCIASSSSIERLKASLKIIGLYSEFEGRVFSVEQVARGKPAPDVFLYAASVTGHKSGDCWVIEDSVSGIKAANAAQMTAIGLLAGSHVDESHGDKLKSAGALLVADTYQDILALLQRST